MRFDKAQDKSYGGKIKDGVRAASCTLAKDQIKSRWPACDGKVYRGYARVYVSQRIRPNSLPKKGANKHMEAHLFWKVYVHLKSACRCTHEEDTYGP